MRELKENGKVTCTWGANLLVSCLPCLFWRFVYFGVRVSVITISDGCSFVMALDPACPTRPFNVASSKSMCGVVI